MAPTRILVVDDEETLCEVLKLNLENEGYAVDTAYSAEQALRLDLSAYSLILLDVMMGEISGIRLAWMLKQNPDTASIPIIFTTAKDSDDDIVSGLDLGADDYIVKPYTVKVVLARVKTVLRRWSSSVRKPQEETREDYQLGELHIDTRFKRCTLGGKDVPLAKKEFEILVYLVRNRGRICSRDEILASVWKEEVIVLDRTIDVNITRLRQKLGAYGKHIVTRSGFGYGFKE